MTDCKYAPSRGSHPSASIILVFEIEVVNLFLFCQLFLFVILLRLVF